MKRTKAIGLLAAVIILAAGIFSVSSQAVVNIRKVGDKANPGPSVSAWAISPNYANDKTLFAGTTADGIFKSTDGGASWRLIKKAASLDDEVGDIAVSPNYATDSIIFTTTLDNGVMKSPNKGASWTAAKSGLPNTSLVMPLAISPNYANDATLFGGVILTGIYKTTNAGTSWINSTSNLGATEGLYLVLSIIIPPNYATNNTVFAVNFGAGPYKSTDGGANWTQINTGVPNAASGFNSAYVIASSPNFAVDNTLFLGTLAATTKKAVYKSTDGGANWSASSTGLPAGGAIYVQVSPNYAVDGTVFASVSGYGVYKSTDGGSSWSAAKSGLSTKADSAVMISPNYAADNTAFAASSFGMYKTTNGGQSWGPINNGISAVTEIEFEASKEKIKRGKKVKLFGEIDTFGGFGVGGVKILIKENGKTIAIVKTKSNGKFAAKIRPGATKSYQAIFKGKGRYRSSKSEKVKIKVVK